MHVFGLIEDSACRETRSGAATHEATAAKVAAAARRVRSVDDGHEIDGALPGHLGVRAQAPAARTRSSAMLRSTPGIRTRTSKINA